MYVWDYLWVHSAEQCFFALCRLIANLDRAAAAQAHIYVCEPHMGIHWFVIFILHSQLYVYPSMDDCYLKLEIDKYFGQF